MSEPRQMGVVVNVRYLSAALGYADALHRLRNMNNEERTTQVAEASRPVPRRNSIDADAPAATETTTLETGSGGLMPMEQQRDKKEEEEDDETLMLFCYFDALPLPLQLSVLQFLSVRDLVSVRQMDRARRDLLTSNDALCTLWKPACERSWPWIFDSKTSSAGLEEHQQVKTDCKMNDFARLLLDLNVDRERQSVDASRFPRQVQFTDDTQTAIQFTGEVGPNDRCIRAKAPLPRPTRRIQARPLHANFFVPERRPYAQWQAYVEQWKPFVSPFCVAGAPSNVPTTTTITSSRSCCVSLKPRLASYFEVTILRPVEHFNDSDNNQHHDRNSDCVAIGVAAADFAHRWNMPGWTINSFGYHGDDGGYFHGRGLPRDNLLPEFGAGDCVGCGIDYAEGSIFFCKNGEFLRSIAIGAERLLSQDLYPVVGLDSRCPIRVNFGTSAPFQFDLEAFVEEHQSEQVANGLRR